MSRTKQIDETSPLERPVSDAEVVAAFDTYAWRFVEFETARAALDRAKESLDSAESQFRALARRPRITSPCSTPDTKSSAADKAP